MAAANSHLTAIDGGAEPSAPAPVGSSAWSTKLRKDAKLLAKSLDTAYIQLAEKLWLIYDTPVEGDPNRGSVCTQWKDRSGNYYTSFDRYVEAELDLHPKKAARLRAIWKTLKIDLDLADTDLARFVRLGMSKARELARPGVLTPDNIEAWVSRAENSTVVSLCSAVTKYVLDRETELIAEKAEEVFEQSQQMEQEYNGSLAGTPTASSAERALREQKKVEDLDVLSKQFNCLLLGDQIETVNTALKRSMALSNSDKIGHNLSLICLDFVMTNDFGFESEDQSLRFLAKFEKLLGKKLIVIDPDINDVVYGFGALEKFSKA